MRLPCNLTHPAVGDLVVKLVGPNGTEVLLTNQRGGSGDNVTATLDDEALTAISAGSAPFAGSFRPEQPLSAIDGGQMDGQWRLYVTDTRRNNTGTIDRWGVTIRPILPLCAPLGFANCVSFSAPAYSVPEINGTVPITLTLSAPLAIEESMIVKSSPGSASDRVPADFSSTYDVVSFAPGETQKVVNVRVYEDTRDEFAESFQLSITKQNDRDPVLGTPHRATITIQDNDAPPSVELSGSSVNVHENVGMAHVTARLSTASGKPVTVAYSSSPGTATAGSDYTAAPGTLTFAAGETQKTFSVPIGEDSAAEASETIKLTLSNPTNAALGTPTSQITINTNDTLNFATANYTVGENSGTALITVKLNAPSASPVTVRYATSNGTATAGSDYTATSGTLSFAPGETQKTFTVPISEDATDEPNESIVLTLSNPANAALGPPSTASLTIIDND